jgi:hypothetical protein
MNLIRRALDADRVDRGLPTIAEAVEAEAAERARVIELLERLED